MARALSQVYTIIRGSVGGLTYLANQYHQIVVRARTAPVQPGSTPQAQMRTAFSASQASWRGATDTERDEWAAYAKSKQHSGPLGNYTVPGRLELTSTISLASYLNTVFGESIPISSAAPLGTGWLLISNVHTVAPGLPGSGFDLSVENNEDHAIVVFAEISPSFRATKNFYKGPWFVGRSQVFSVPPSTVGVLPFVNLAAGSIYFIRVRAISDSVEHRISEEFFLRAVAETNP